jgi:hypothetical protein
MKHYIEVKPSEKETFKVMVDGIQQGINYSTEELANKEAKNIKQKMGIKFFA